MNPINILIGIYGLYKLISLLTESKIEKELPRPYSETKEKQSYRLVHPKYNYTNGVLIKGSLRNYYSELLDLQNQKVVNPDLIYEHFHQLTFELESTGIAALNQNNNIDDYIAAKDYMVDVCNYLGSRN
jgi:hypothetical protein